MRLFEDFIFFFYKSMSYNIFLLQSSLIKVISLWNLSTVTLLLWGMPFGDFVYIRVVKVVKLNSLQFEIQVFHSDDHTQIIFEHEEL